MKLIFMNHDHGEVVIDRGTLSLGSGARNDVVLDAEGITDKHARISREEGGVFIRAVEDADVYVNGRRIRERTELHSGDVIGLHRVQTRIAIEPGDLKRESDEEEADEREQTQATRVRPAVTNWYLRGVSGESFGRVLPLSGRMVVGRGSSADIVFNADEISRQHAVIEVAGDEVRVQDMESANGTFVNGERIKKHVLKRGDEIAFDKLRFRLEAGPSRKSSPRAAPSPPAREPAASNGGRGVMPWLIASGGVVALLAAVVWWLGWF